MTILLLLYFCFLTFLHSFSQKLRSDAEPSQKIHPMSSKGHTFTMKWQSLSLLLTSSLLRFSPKLCMTAPSSDTEINLIQTLVRLAALTRKLHLPVRVPIKHIEHRLYPPRRLDPRGHHWQEFIKFYCSIFILSSRKFHIRIRKVKLNGFFNFHIDIVKNVHST